MTNRSPRSLKARTSRTVTLMGSRLLSKCTASDGPSVRSPQSPVRKGGVSVGGGTIRSPRPVEAGLTGRIGVPLLLPKGAAQSRGGGCEEVRDHAHTARRGRRSGRFGRGGAERQRDRRRGGQRMHTMLR